MYNMLSKVLFTVMVVASHRAQCFTTATINKSKNTNLSSTLDSKLNPLYDGSIINRSISPLADIMKMINEFDRGFNVPQPLSLDVKETATSYEIQVDTPAVDKKNIQLTIKDHILTIDVEKKGMHKEEGENFHRVERFRGHTTRSLALPNDANEDNVTAEVDNGVLHIKIEKTPESEKPHDVKKIQIK